MNLALFCNFVQLYLLTDPKLVGFNLTVATHRFGGAENLMSLKRIAEGFSGGRKSCPEKEIHQMIPLKKAGKPLSPGMEEKKDEESPDLCGRFLWLVFKVTKPFS